MNKLQKDHQQKPLVYLLPKDEREAPYKPSYSYLSTKIDLKTCLVYVILNKGSLLLLLFHNIELSNLQIFRTTFLFLI